MKKPENKNSTQQILNHILDITSGECKITEEMILNEKDEDFRLILLGLLHLHEDVEYRISVARENKDLEKLNAQLNAKNREMEQFAYIASHDLQEPVRTISNFAQLLHTDYSGKFDETADKSLSFIIKAADRMSSLIKGLLDYSRIGRELRISTVDCTQVLEDLKEDLSSIIQETKTSLIVDPLPEVIGNETDIRLVFQNLINNAIKFRREDVIPEIKISVLEGKRFWKFTCTDNGIGIAEKHQKRIFQIFQRLHSRQDYDGTGIGLSHCRKIVNLHGGKIWVDSTINQGSTFYFTLPNA